MVSFILDKHQQLKKDFMFFTILVFLLVALAAFCATVPYASLFEYLLHKYVMHRSFADGNILFMPMPSCITVRSKLIIPITSKLKRIGKPYP